METGKVMKKGDIIKRGIEEDKRNMIGKAI
jgi:hypothetical protein